MSPAGVAQDSGRERLREEDLAGTQMSGPSHTLVDHGVFISPRALGGGESVSAVCASQMEAQMGLSRVDFDFNLLILNS